MRLIYRYLFQTYTVTAILIAAPAFLNATNIDSLKTELQNTTTDSAFLNISNTLVAHYRNRSNYPAALDVANEALRRTKNKPPVPATIELLISKSSIFNDIGKPDSGDFYMDTALKLNKSSTLPSSKAFVYMLAGVIYDEHEISDSALKYYQKSREIYDTLDNPVATARLLNNESHALKGKGYERIGLEKLMRAKGIFDSLGLKKQAAVVQMNIGSRYLDLGENEDALYHMKQALKVFSASNHPRRLPEIHTNIADAFMAVDSLDTARYHVKEALRIKRKNGLTPSYAISLFSLGDIEFRAGNLDIAREKYDSVQSLCAEMNVPIGIYHGDIGLAKVALQKGEYDKALQHSRNAEKVAGEIINPQLKSQTHELLYKIYKKTDNYEDALIHLEKLKILNDSLTNTRRDSRIEELKIQFETEQKDKENEQLRREAAVSEATSQRQNLIMLFSGILILLLIVFAVTLYRYNRIKSKTNKNLKKDQLLKENQNRELKHLNEVKNKLLSIVGHDLKGPLGSISSILSLINSGELSKDEQKELMLELEKQTNSTRILLENVMHWAKSQLEGFKTNPQKFKPRTSVQDVLNLFESKTKQKELTLNNSINEELTLYADVNLFELVIRNLVSNAVKFSNPGGHVSIDSVEKDGNIQFQISDSGVGIPKKEIDQLFKGGMTRPGTGKEMGSGLGLMLCKEAVNSWGGDIHAENKPEGGSVFTFNVPKK